MLEYLEDNAKWLFGQNGLVGVIILLLGVIASYLMLRKKPDSPTEPSIKANKNDVGGDFNVGNETHGSHNSGPTVIGDHAQIGITEAEYRERLERETSAKDAEIKRLDAELKDAIRSEGAASGKAEALQAELELARKERIAFETKLNDSANAYAELQTTLTALREQITDLHSRNPGRVPDAVFETIMAALHSGELNQAERLINPLLEAPVVDDILRDQAQLYAISGEIAEERIDYHAAKAHYIRAAEFQPQEMKYLRKASEYARKAGDYRKAEQFARDGLALVKPEDEEGLAWASNELGVTLNAQGRYDEAGPYYRKGLEISERVLGLEHPDTAASYNNVGSNLNAQGRYDEAEPLFAKAAEIMTRVLGENHPHAVILRRNYEIFLAERAAAGEE